MGENKNINNKDQNIINIEVLCNKGGICEGIPVSETFIIKKEDNTEIEFKPMAVENGLLIPMFKSDDNTPYYQLIDYDTIDFIIEQFIEKRLILNKPISMM